MKILFIFGTRPEAIKMAPLIKTFQKSECDVKVCVTAQHREMLDQVLNFFNIKADYDLNLMKPNQTLFDITTAALKGLKIVLDDCEPDLVFVQGDTTTAFIGALASFYNKVKVVHIEAGLRSFNKYSPFPEEINRSLVARLADYHFAPTEKAKNNLLKEGVKDNVHVVGNTVIDALFMGLDIIKSRNDEYENLLIEKGVDFSKRIVLVTGHRRESFGEPFEDICLALKEISRIFDDVQILYPVHLNPNVKECVYRILGDNKRVCLIEPVDYPTIIFLMSKCYLILTDSGGIQEEAPALGKPVLVMRDVTERVDGNEAGTAKLVGTNKEVIVNEAKELLVDSDVYGDMARASNPYGDGKTCERIVAELRC